MATIHIVIAGQTISAHLYDNPTARELAQRLPMTLTFRDFNRLEKIASLPEPLTTQGVPAGDDPEVADIGYYGPTQDLVLYYGDVGYWNGIVRVGQFDSNQLTLVQNQPDGFHVTIEND
ncbi:cyclophilin-like fold protein [Mycobacteroides salmoniphilum]|uniref:cyclophilin-like fold protein n=1 Tax=Mycobacteroides salmoniphilum TaxID=404941 RepID=UPI00195CDA2C|nr:cyclophilin-like fold protein [Mycobacteroides salmoniphilum]